jgi:hypothetical protein
MAPVALQGGSVPRQGNTVPQASSMLLETSAKPYSAIDNADKLLAPGNFRLQDYMIAPTVVIGVPLRAKVEPMSVNGTCDPSL